MSFEGTQIVLLNSVSLGLVHSVWHLADTQQVFRGCTKKIKYIYFYTESYVSFYTAAEELHAAVRKDDKVIYIRAVLTSIASA